MVELFDYFGLTYETISDKEVKLVDARTAKATTRLLIPKMVEHDGKKYTVTGIGRGIYGGTYDIGICSIGRNTPLSVISIVLPDTIKTISARAFGVTLGELKEINIPSGVKSIPLYAFYRCESLPKIDLPEGLTNIGDGAFYNCHALEKIAIPSSVKVIGSHAFYHCEALKSIDIPEGVTKIEEGTFEGCKQLKTITIPSSVETIDEKALTSAETINILNEEGNVIIHPNAFSSSAKVNYLGKKAAKSAPKKAEEKNTDTKKAEAPKAEQAPKKVVAIDLEKLISAALADGVVTDKERSVLIKKVKEAGGDVDEFEMLLDARIYEAQQKAKPAEEAPVKKSTTTHAEAAEVAESNADETEEAEAAEKKEKVVYVFKGANYKKKTDLVQAVVHDYIEKHDVTTIEELKQVFDVRVKKGIPMVLSLDDALKTTNSAGEAGGNFAISEEMQIPLKKKGFLGIKTGVNVVVWRYWPERFFDSFLELAQRIGCKIEVKK